MTHLGALCDLVCDGQGGVVLPHLLSMHSHLANVHDARRLPVCSETFTVAPK